jgi:hypothetical protein
MRLFLLMLLAASAFGQNFPQRDWTLWGNPDAQLAFLPADQAVNNKAFAPVSLVTSNAAGFTSDNGLTFNIVSGAIPTATNQVTWWWQNANPSYDFNFSLLVDFKQTVTNSAPLWYLWTRRQLEWNLVRANAANRDVWELDIRPGNAISFIYWNTTNTAFSLLYTNASALFNNRVSIGVTFASNGVIRVFRSGELVSTSTGNGALQDARLHGNGSALGVQLGTGVAFDTQGRSFGGTIYRAAYWPRTLTDAEMQQETSR